MGGEGEVWVEGDPEDGGIGFEGELGVIEFDRGVLLVFMSVGSEKGDRRFGRGEGQAIGV